MGYAVSEKAIYVKKTGTGRKIESTNISETFT
jgi:hypothetical protein